MKKIIYLITVVFGLSVFLAGYSSEIDRQSRISDGPYPELVSQDPQLKSDFYQLTLPEADWIHRVPDTLEDISRECQTVFLIRRNVPNKEMREETEMFAVLPEDLEYPAFTVTGLPVNKEMLQVTSFTTDAKKAESQGMELLDFTNSTAQYSPEPVTSIHSVSRMEPLQGQNVFNLQVITRDPSGTEKALKNRFSSRELMKLETGGDLVFTESLQPEFLEEMLLVFGAGLIILAICWFFQNRREIMIRKLMGQDTSVIFIQLFLPSILLFLALFVSVLLLFYLIFAGDFRPVNQRLFSYLVRQSLWFMAGLTVCAVLILFSIHSLDLLESLKENRGESRFSVSGFLVKTACISLSLTALVSCLYVVYGYSRELVLVQRSRPYTCGRIALNWIDTREYDEAGKTQESAELQNFIQEVPLLFQRVLMYNNSFDYAEFDREITPVYCNTAYLEKYPLLDQEGNPLELSAEKEYILIPEHLPSKLLQENIDYDQAEVIRIQKGQTHRALSAWNDADRLQFTDAVYRVTQRWDPFISNFATGASHYFEATESRTLEETEDLLNARGFQRLSWLKTSDSYITKTRMLTKYLMMRTGILLTVLSVFAVLMFYTTQLFLIDEKNKIAVQTLMGQGYFSRYGMLLLANAAVYLGCALLGICFLQTDPALTLWLLGGCFLLDLGISSVMIHRFEKRKLAGCLKGDDI